MALSPPKFEIPPKVKGSGWNTGHHLLAYATWSQFSKIVSGVILSRQRGMRFKPGEQTHRWVHCIYTAIHHKYHHAWVHCIHIEPWVIKRFLSIIYLDFVNTGIVLFEILAIFSCSRVSSLAMICSNFSIAPALSWSRDSRRFFSFRTSSNSVSSWRIVPFNLSRALHLSCSTNPSIK